MGNGYLGKISAIVTANTGDFKPKLDAAASDVQKFAKSVEGTLRSATTQNARAFEGIWSPFQKMERAIQAANSMKLSFKGFDSAIRDVDALNSRLAALAKRQVAINVKGTGFSDASSLREAFRGIRQSDVEWVKREGGLSLMRAHRGAFSDDEQKRLDKFSKFGSLDRMGKVVSTMNDRAIEESNRRLRQMTSAAEELGRPLTQAQQVIGSLSLEIQGQFAPALNKASQGVENLKDAIEKGSIGGAYFDGVRQRVERTIASISRLKEAQQLSQSGMTGNELAFRAPFASDELAKSAALSRAAASAPASARAQPAFTAQVQQLDSLRKKIEMYRAAIERRELLDLDTTSATAKLDAVIAKSAAVRKSLESMVAPKAASDIFGASLGSTPAKLSGLESRIKSLQSSISQLPEPIQSKMIPALEKARNAFFALGQNPTAAELAKAAQQAGNLERQLKRVQTSMQFKGTFKGFLDDNAANKYAMQLRAIQQGMASVGATAGGPVAQAVNKYQRALYEASNAGRLGTEATKKQMDELLQKIAQVAVASGNMTKKQAQSFVQMVQHSGKGDISRMGMGNFNLAMQQAAFAVDDFMSSTGGLEFKLRAISNNLTQMAFILGSTKALWLAVGAVMATTIGIPILKAIFSFDEFENQNKALNDELEKSKNIAEKTAEAYKELGKALRESGMGSAAGKVAAFGEERRQEAADRARSEVLQRSPDFARAQSRVIALEKKLEGAADVGRRGEILRELDAAKKERDRLRESSIAPSSMSDVKKAIERAMAAEIESLAGDPELTARKNQLGNRTATEAKNPQEAIAQLDAQIKSMSESLKPQWIRRMWADNLPDFGGFEPPGVSMFRRVREEQARLEGEKARLEQELALQRNQRFQQRAMAAAAAAELTPGARDRMSRLGLGSNATARFESQIEGVSKEFASIITELEKVTREGGSTAVLEKAADDAARALEFLYQEADKVARGVALGSIIPTKERLDRAAEQLNGMGPSAIATDIARAQAYRETVESERNRAKVRGDGFGVNRADYELDRIDRLAVKLEAAAIAVSVFQKAIEKAALALSSTLVQEAQNREQELRRAANRFAGRPEFQNAAGEAAAEADRQEDRDRRLRDRLRREKIAFEKEIANDRELSALAESARKGREAAGNKELTPEQQAAGMAAAEAAEVELERRFERRAGTVRARREVDAADAAAAQERDRVARENERRRKIFGGIEQAQGSAVGAAAELGAGRLEEAVGLNAEMDQLRQRMEDAIAAGIEAPFEDLMDDVRRRIEELNASLLDEKIIKEKGKSREAEGQLDAARRNLNGIGASDLQGKMTELDVRRRDLERRRDEALLEKTPEGDARAVAIQKEIDAQQQLAAEINAASVAVGAFQDALNKAAMTLQNTLANETEGRANDARRAANDAEAVFGVGSPEAKRAREKQDRAEASMRAAQAERDRAEAAINAERVKFEQEMAGGGNPEAAARAKRIAELEAEAADENVNAQQRNAARAEANRLRREQEREFEARPGVQAERKRADEADRAMARRQSVERGLEMGRTEEDKRKEDIGRQAGDLGNAIKELKATGRGGEVKDFARNAAINMARDVAPLFAQMTDEVMTARLQGPSRAALNVSDINTQGGATELNRLIRGDDSAKDVNLAEMRKQSNLLEAIEKAVRDTAGVVVNL